MTHLPTGKPMTDERAEEIRKHWADRLGFTAQDIGELLDERDRIREQIKRVRALRDQIASGPTVGLIRSLVVQELDAALDQGEDQDGTTRNPLIRSPYATGGVVPGPPSTSDTIPAFLSEGHHTTQRPGETPAQAMNRLTEGEDL